MPSGSLVFDGNSLTSGYAGTTPWPEQLTDNLSYTGDPDLDIANEAVSGTTTFDTLGHAVAEIDSHYVAGDPVNIACLAVGTNDIYLGSAPRHVFNRLRRLCAERRVVGFDVVIATICPSNLAADFEARRQAVNTLIRTHHPSFAAGLADIGHDDSVIGGAGDQNNATYYQADGTHWKDPGNAACAAIFEPVVEALVEAAEAADA